MQVQSKLAPIGASCIQVVHPWTDSCFQGSHGCSVATFLDSLRIYGAVYLLALAAKRKVPTGKDLRNTLSGIVRSSVFLTVTGVGIMGITCLLRNLLGHFYFPTVIWIPCFIASIAAILVERRSRRTMLCLYVCNIATETVWKMFVTRKMATPVKHFEVAIFTAAITALLYYYRSGSNGDVNSIFRFMVGPCEEVNYKVQDVTAENGTSNAKKASTRDFSTGCGTLKYSIVAKALRAYSNIVANVKQTRKHETCPHPYGCVHYSLQGTTKLFGIGMCAQLALKTVFGFKKFLKKPSAFKDVFCQRDVFYLALFLGGFSGTFRAVNCALRHATGFDSPYHAIPGGMAAGAWFSFFPNTTVALYAMWKTLEISYRIGRDRGRLPNVPGFTEFLYCFATAILFHNAIFEPATIRPSYIHFLHTISGGRMTNMNRVPLDAWGLNSSEILKTIVEKNKLSETILFPRGIFQR